MWREEDSLRCSSRNHCRLIEIGSLIDLELTEHESFFVLGNPKDLLVPTSLVSGLEAPWITTSGRGLNPGPQA